MTNVVNFFRRAMDGFCVEDTLNSIAASMSLSLAVGRLVAPRLARATNGPSLSCVRRRRVRFVDDVNDRTDCEVCRVGERVDHIISRNRRIGHHHD